MKFEKLTRRRNHRRGRFIGPDVGSRLLPDYFVKRHNYLSLHALPFVAANLKILGFH